MLRQYSVPWVVLYAAAQIDAYGWDCVPSHLALAVQMWRNEGGCSSCNYLQERCA